MTKRYYTVAQANALLPDLTRQMMMLRRARAEVAERHMQLEWLKFKDEAVNTEAIFKEEAEIEFILITTRKQLEHLHNLGIQIKNIDQGLVDFLTIMDGEQAYLCWRMGETEIAYWHGINDGFAGRKRVHTHDIGGSYHD